ncbi:MAG: SRPBCC family protein [Pseudonocardia sp.]
MIDLIAELGRVRRSVGKGTSPAGAGHVVELRRTYDSPIEDVWDACTHPVRIGRWFLPVNGDLRLGGSYQLEGNASGDIIECEPPRRVAVTWVFADDVSLVSVDLTPTGQDGTELLLRHVVNENDHWATYGPGATGVGWELALFGLAHFLQSGESVSDPAAFEASPEARAFLRRSAQEWGQAHAASGAPPATAREAADRTSAFYAPDPENVL